MTQHASVVSFFLLSTNKLFMKKFVIIRGNSCSRKNHYYGHLWSVRDNTTRNTQNIAHSTFMFFSAPADFTSETPYLRSTPADHTPVIHGVSSKSADHIPETPLTRSTLVVKAKAFPPNRSSLVDDIPDTSFHQIRTCGFHPGKSGSPIRSCGFHSGKSGSPIRSCGFHKLDCFCEISAFWWDFSFSAQYLCGYSLSIQLSGCQVFLDSHALLKFPSKSSTSGGRFE